jgi:hypothetical protein
MTSRARPPSLKASPYFASTIGAVRPPGFTEHKARIEAVAGIDEW